MLTKNGLDKRSIELRRTIVKMVEASRRGHLASAFSIVEIIRVLYDSVLRYDPQNPTWKERDRFILSKGHGCLALYAVLADKGFFSKSELLKFCQIDGILGGHPEYGKIPGVEASTGSLGHGLPIGIGFALNARYEKAKHRVFVVISDGESNEGSIWEASLCASKHKLDNLVVLMDYNKQQSYGSTSEVLDLEPVIDKWKCFGFEVQEVDGHDVAVLQSILSKTPFAKDKPSMIVCHTIKGRGIGFIEKDLRWHHKPKISDEEIRALYAGLGDITLSEGV